MIVLSIILSIILAIQAMPVSIKLTAGQVISKLSQEEFSLLTSAIYEKTAQIDIATSQVSKARLAYEKALLDAKEEELKSYEHIGHDSFGVVALDEEETIVNSGLSKVHGEDGEDRKNAHNQVAIALQKYQKILKNLEALEGEHDRLANAMIERI